ncbi:similar to Saccharomyces cerevisiae YLR284C Peroxisomal delta3,delta2-enoyl-CoA isomerase [Maudiozyma barnettii]|uniref:Similar to Saccharomyces cerevisiae YLR284C Peroxisomal delta3,delta2-enoyl-CoA isomerase n=1 Tax=Maudiozyma barnettii TaxID=61262 RepID=A0A8H2VHW7_9SACH|nr:dodecenoyl-CoA isomerase [Kazachstania barnettii]CAB4255860.1 similar to Saccharomyces cerevisiae YLR284C Peroxisomal delta3,delta2-enoyl-CoA isomerase [Kazachstania barnettii]CAD1784420.1 similar to Saccharomyces cerevisiae YLR284C Peroxisomal delta3,delta2-enoyl-CoA isomerase [Kazachstania barnettii]
MKTSQEKIAYKVEPPFFIIQFQSPDTLNAMTYDDYIYVTTLLELSSGNPDCYFTVLESSGRFFSSGADFNSIPPNVKDKNGIKQNLDPKVIQKWLENFLCKNQYITQSFIRHDKILIACLNGPAIGLSAAIILLCDLVYAMNVEETYLQFPFSTLGLSNEGAVSWTLPNKLGRNKSFEKLLFAQKVYGYEIQGSVLLKSAIDYHQLEVNCNHDKSKIVQTFNELMIEELRQKCKNIFLPTVLKMKALLKDESLTSQLELINTKEVNSGLPFWVNGIPQGRFQVLKNLKKAARENKNKL